ncbi:Dolichyldiphosphatase [Candida viswanathii]|uniref:Dolichyldiphosphatase n=1 Tax=Candida viswanathii TaxID=5486 RepID=A0A367Y3V9_9ASCO|nr:Dolichyldiphosphatase [Candida viswanathii]
MNSTVYNPIPFDHTYLLYDPNDIISLVCVHFSLLPIYIMVYYTSWFLITREIEPVIIVGGHLANEVINKVVKMLVKSPRPAFHAGFGTNSKYGLSYGFPSAHSQFMGFFVGYYTCIILFKIPKMPARHKRIVCVMAVLSMLGVAFSRVYLLYHSCVQVIAGLIVGVTFGVAYFEVTSMIRDLGVVEWVLNWPIVRFFYVKDTYFYNYQTFAQEYQSYKKLRLDKKEELKKVAQEPS